VPAKSYTAFPVVRQKDRGTLRTIEAMAQAPWIDADEVDSLVKRYPTVPRSRIELILDACWPVKDDVEAALLELVARQQRDSGESLDYTAPTGTPASERAQPPRL
jgi:hypothetical protein